MTDYISRAEVLKYIAENSRKYRMHLELCRDNKAMQADISRIPAADVAPVRHGTWLPIVEANEDGSPYQAGVLCSECGHCDCVETNYCSDCGAIMDACGR